MKKSFLALMLIFALAVPTYAQEGSITINSDGNVVNYNIYKVADEDMNFSGDFGSLNVEIEEIDSAYDMAIASYEISEYIDENNVECLESEKALNEVTFDNLSEGWYYVEYNKESDVNMQSVLLSVPTFDTDQLVYDININAKARTDEGGNPGGGDTGGGAGGDIEVTPFPEETTSGGGNGNGDEETTSGGNLDDNNEVTTKNEGATEESTGKAEDGENNGLEGTTSEENPIIEALEEDYSEITSIDSDGNVVTLPKTGGDKTILICYYAGVVSIVLGGTILLINNIKKKGK